MSNFFVGWKCKKPNNHSEINWPLIINLFFSKAVESDLPEDLKNEAASRFQAAIDSRMAIGPTMSFYPDFVAILSKFYPDKIAIWIKLG